jgi:GTPase SAR1 family protein
MGNTNSDMSLVAIIVGNEKAGKSLFLKKILELKKKEKETFGLEPTLGFNYVTIEYSNQSYHIWEFGGDPVSRSYWPSFYRNLSVNIVIYIINVFDTDNHQTSIKEFLYLVNEEELKIAKFSIIFNIKLEDRKKLNFTEQDLEEVKLKVDKLLTLIQESPIHDYDNRVSHFICDISKLKEGEFNTMKMLNKCLLVKEKENSLI